MSFDLTLQDLLEAGAHYGHRASRWNPKMRPFIYGARNSVHVINLAMTMAYAEDAYNHVVDVVSKGGSVLFVGTKPQAREPLKAEAQRGAQFFMVHRWLGGTLTNFRTMRKSIDKIKKIQEMEADGTFQLMTKKEVLKTTRQRDKLMDNLEGILELKRVPGVVFIIDGGHDSIAVDEANKLGVPVIGLCDTNSDPSRLDFPIPANDDAVRSIRLFAALIADAAIEGEAQRQEKLKADEIEEAESSESLADSFIGAEEEDELLSGRTVIKKIKKADDSESDDKSSETTDAANDADSEATKSADDGEKSEAVADDVAVEPAAADAGDAADEATAADESEPAATDEKEDA